MVTLLVLLFAAYLAAGFIFALAFVWRGAGSVDPAAAEGTWGFRVLILPGVTVLWPLLLVRWIRGAGPPEERNPHRDRVAK